MDKSNPIGPGEGLRRRGAEPEGMRRRGGEAASDDVEGHIVSKPREGIVSKPREGITSKPREMDDDDVEGHSVTLRPRLGDEDEGEGITSKPREGISSKPRVND